MSFWEDAAKITSAPFTGGMSLLAGKGFNPVEFGGDMLTGGAIGNAKSVEETNRMQMALADKQMAFQERMSSSAYQRATADMKSAGLNPMLAYSAGPASVPSGAMASLTAPRKGDIGAGFMNSAKAAVTQGAQLSQLTSQTDLNKAQAQTQAEQAPLLREQKEQTAASAEKTRQETKVTKQVQRKTKAEAENAEMARDRQKSRQSTDIDMQKVDAYIERGQEIANIVDKLLGRKGSAYKYSEMEHLKQRGRKGAIVLP